MAEVGPNVGFATLSIIPSLKGIEAEVVAQLGGLNSAAQSAGEEAGSALQDGFASVISNFAVPAAIIGIGVAAVAAAIKVEDATNIIARSTGATGKQLDDLETSFKNVARATPASLETVATALSEVSQRTGLSGAALETFTKQVVTFNRITKDAPVNVQDLTKALAGFGVPATKLSGAFDQLFKASQRTGVPIADLVATLNKSGAIVRQFGLPLGTATTLLTQLDKAGVDSSSTLSGLRTAFALFAREGKAPAEGLKETLAAIDALIKSGDVVGAQQLGVKIFGTRGSGLVDAAIQGKLALGDLSKSFDTVGPGILETAANTSTLSGKFGVLKNNAQLAFAQVGKPILDILNKSLKAAVPLLQSFSAALTEIAKHPNVVTLITALAGAFSLLVVANKAAIAVQALTSAEIGLNFALLANPVVLVAAAIAAMAVVVVILSKKLNNLSLVVIAAFIPFIGLPALIIKNWTQIVTFFSKLVTDVKGFFQALVLAVTTFFQTDLGQNLIAFVQSTFAGITAIVQGALQVITGIFAFFKAVLTGDWSAAWNALLQIVAGVWSAIQGVIQVAMATLTLVLKTGLAIATGIVKSGIEAIAAFFLSLPGRIFALAASAGAAALAVGAAILRGISDGISGAVGALADIGKAVARAIASFVNRFVINPINDALDFTIDLGPFGKHHISAPDIPPLSFATGGVVPGPAGAPILAIVHGGEQILTKDQQAAAGTTINQTLIGSTITAEDLFREARWAQLTGKVKTA